MSSSFFVRREQPADVAEIVRAIGHSVLWADGDLDSLDSWPERSLLLYVPGESSRGVEIVRDADRYQIRVLALSTKTDYDLAFSLVEALGGASIVDVEPDGSAPAGEVRARYGGDWMLRDMAAGIAALQAALDEGHTATISGPVASLEISPSALVDAARWPEVLRRAQVDGPPRTDWDRARAELEAGDDAHAEKLRAEEELAAPSAPPKRRNTWFALAFVPTLLVVVVPALATRLVTWPFRGLIRDRNERRADRRRERSRDALVEATEKLRASPDDVDLRHERAVLLIGMGWRSAADRELVACLDRLAAGAKASVTPGILHYQLSIVRTRMGLPGLAKRSLDAAQAAGLELRRPSWPRRAWREIATFAIGISGMFIAIAGLDPD